MYYYKRKRSSKGMIKLKHKVISFCLISTGFAVKMCSLTEKKDGSFGWYDSFLGQDTLFQKLQLFGLGLKHCFMVEMWDIAGRRAPYWAESSSGKAGKCLVWLQGICFDQFPISYFYDAMLSPISLLSPSCVWFFVFDVAYLFTFVWLGTNIEFFIEFELLVWFCWFVFSHPLNQPLT